MVLSTALLGISAGTVAGGALGLTQPGGTLLGDIPTRREST